MINRSLARRFRRVEAHLNPPRQRPVRIVVDFVDMQKTVVETVIFESGKEPQIVQMAAGGT